jgi:hypothetical protein
MSRTQSGAIADTAMLAAILENTEVRLQGPEGQERVHCHISHSKRGSVEGPARMSTIAPILFFTDVAFLLCRTLCAC